MTKQKTLALIVYSLKFSEDRYNCNDPKSQIKEKMLTNDTPLYSDQNKLNITTTA